MENSKKAVDAVVNHKHQNENADCGEAQKQYS